MKTEYITVDPQNIDAGVIERAGRVIRRGGLVAFPTETVYGLGGNALDGDASRKIYAAKGRPSDNPLIVHIADMEHLIPIVEEIPRGAAEAARAFWPGPLTMILRKKDIIPDATSGGLQTVAVRMPSHPVAAALIRASGGYIAAPSANTSGRPSTTEASHVREDLDGKIDMILDGGPVDIGLESTIIDFTEEVPVILRPGYINREDLTGVLGEVRLDPGLTDAGAYEGIRPKAPGMRYRHYAPRAELTIVDGPPDRVIERILALSQTAVSKGLSVGIMAGERTKEAYEGHGYEVRTIGDRADEDVIARHLFSVLREFDHLDVQVIFSESFDTPRLGMAIMNRLLKAAGHRVEEV